MASTCGEGPAIAQKPVFVSPHSDCGSSDCEYTITIAYGFDPHNREATGLPMAVVQDQIRSSWSDVAISVGDLNHCVAVSDGSEECESGLNS